MASEGTDYEQTRDTHQEEPDPPNELFRYSRRLEHHVPVSSARARGVHATCAAKQLFINRMIPQNKQCQDSNAHNVPSRTKANAHGSTPLRIAHRHPDGTRFLREHSRHSATCAERCRTATAGKSKAGFPYSHTGRGPLSRYLIAWTQFLPYFPRASINIANDIHGIGSLTRAVTGLRYLMSCLVSDRGETRRAPFRFTSKQHAPKTSGQAANCTRTLAPVPKKEGLA